MKKIGFFGGCFSPPSNVHINLAKELVENKLVDNVVFIPVGDYYKKQNLIKAEYRYNMLLLACKGYEYLKVDNITLNSKKTLYAIDTFKLIYEKYKNNDTEIYFIMGSDNFNKISNWKSYDEIIKNYKYIVIERPKYKIESNIDNVIYYNNNQKEDMSATRIRNLLKNNANLEQYLDKKVIYYIKQNKLYI